MNLNELAVATGTSSFLYKSPFGENLTYFTVETLRIKAEMEKLGLPVTSQGLSEFKRIKTDLESSKGA